MLLVVDVRIEVCTRGKIFVGAPREAPYMDDKL